MKQGIDAEHIERAERLKFENSRRLGNRCLSDGRNYLWCSPSFAHDHTPTEYLGRLARYAGRCLTNGRAYPWATADFSVYSTGKAPADLVAYSVNAPQRILRATAEVFETDIYCEYEPQFWGFATEAEWEAALKALAREDG